MSSFTDVRIPIVAALKVFKELCGEDQTIMNPNHDYQRFIGSIYARMSSVVDELPYIESFAAREIDTLNEELAKRGYTIRLAPEPPVDGAVVSFLELLVRWKERGEKCFIERDGVAYPASQNKKGTHYAELHGQPMVQIDTDDPNIIVVLAKHNTQPADLHGAAEDILANRRPVHYTGVKFPFIDLHDEPDLDFLIGTRIKGSKDELTITQALQETILKMNNIGALAKSALAVGATRTAFEKEKILVFDEAFQVIFARATDKTILFTAWCDTDSWQDPGDFIT